MGSFQKLVFVFLFFSFQDLVTSVEDNCPIASCSENSLTPTVQYPFSILKDNNQRKEIRKDCVYPHGFDLSCRNRNETILKLPISGEFDVRDINYFTQRIQLSDPGECLPRRYLQNISLSGTPYVSEAYKFYIFSNCSTEGYSNLTQTYGKMSTSIFYPIDCLSSSTHTVLATVSTKNMSIIHSMNTSNCKVIDSNVTAPSKSDWSSNGDFHPFSDLYLTWVLPEKERRDLSKGLLSLLIIGAGLPVFIGVLWCCRYGFTGYGYNDPNDHQTQTELSTSGLVRNGLDESIIRSYSRTILSESPKFLDPENTVCSICLADYKPKDTLKSMPECNHYFHVDCIDGWLRMNGSCPVCRKSPLRSPLVVPPA
ncbi:hypothetical protein C5167_047601 [Papaver somniferum]|uniref:RING-type E3 ubiquitin transferase n=1 Tax=Papaver somniferum TaxID=3469 RepID=A0A4Y7LKZ7_PAPSO|nr:putative RING-H2 finger protein ATL21A [Papaver somniferum]RZC84819.1 hypothetical protein C5167_047601 [Papaver somniferum]